MTAIATKEYVDVQVKRILDAIGIDLPPMLESDSGIDEQALIEPKEIRAAEIVQDPEHRMITDAQIELFRRKPNLLEVKEEITTAKKVIEAKLDETYLKLLNMPNGVNRLRRLSMILQNEDVLAELFKVLDDTVTQEELKEHAADGKHLTNVDRKSLILLQSIINSGALERLKKLSNGGIHASTADFATDTQAIDGKTIKDLVKVCRPWTLLIGNSKYCQRDECDCLVDESSLNIDHFLINLGQLTKQIKFSQGRFIFLSPSFGDSTNEGRIISGQGHSTVLEVNSLTSKGHTFRDLTIMHQFKNDLADLYVSNTKFEDVVLEGCRIHVNEEVVFSNCKFTGCEFKFSIASRDLIIASSFFKDCPIPKERSAINFVISACLQI